MFHQKHNIMSFPISFDVMLQKGFGIDIQKDVIKAFFLGISTEKVLKEYKTITLHLRQLSSELANYWVQ